MPTLSRMQAEALLRTARAARPLYDDLRPAYTRLDPLVALLRRRGFTGLMYAAGRPGEGVVWFDHGRLHSGWLLLPEARDVVIQRDDPLAALRALWADADAIIAVHPGPPPLTANAIDAAAPARATGPPAAAAPAQSVTPLAPAPVRPAAPAPRATPPPDGRGSVAVSGPAGRARGALPARPAAEITTAGAALAAVPWDRLLPEALARVRRHRGSPLAQQLEEAVNIALAPDAAVSGRDVFGPIAPEKGAVALQAIAEGLRRVAGAAFTERLLWTLARDFDCEAAVKHLLQPFAAEKG